LFVRDKLLQIRAIVLFALTLLVGPPAFAETPLPAAPLALDIYNFGQIDPMYFRGAQPDQKGFAALAKAGVKTVIDLQAKGIANEKQLVEAAGMKYVRIPMTTHVPPTPEQLTQFLELVTDPASQPVYVHCKEGRHRTGVMTAVYRMTKDGWHADKAFDEMKRFKFGWAFLHSEFKRFVYAFKPAAVKFASVIPGDARNAITPKAMAPVGAER
jgi:protein-tyrosine phosphatase